MSGERFIYALCKFTVEKRAKGWYFARSANRHDSNDGHGPYRSEASVAMMIARQLRRLGPLPDGRESDKLRINLEFNDIIPLIARSVALLRQLNILGHPR